MLSTPSGEAVATGLSVRTVGSIEEEEVRINDLLIWLFYIILYGRNEAVFVLVCEAPPPRAAR